MELQTGTSQTQTGLLEKQVRVELAYDHFYIFLNSALSEYPKELACLMFGNCLDVSNIKVNLFTHAKPIKQTKTRYWIDLEKQAQVKRNLRALNPYEKRLGDAHTHTLKRRDVGLKPRPQDLQSLLDALDRNTEPSKDDKEDMLKNKRPVYLIIAISPVFVNSKYWMHTEQGALFGTIPVDNTPEYHIYTRAFSYDPIQKDFTRARIQCKFPQHLEHFLVKQPTN